MGEVDRRFFFLSLGILNLTLRALYSHGFPLWLDWGNDIKERGESQPFRVRKLSLSALSDYFDDGICR